MKKLSMLITVLLVVGCADSTQLEKNPLKTEQLYKGYSNSGGYLCYLKISPGNKVIFTYETEGNSMYAEHSGTIKAINDSTYHISCNLTFGQFVCKPSNLDSLMIFVDPPSLIDMKSIMVQYENGDLMKGKRMDRSKLSFAIDDRLFNEYTPATILTDHIHPITGNALTIKASFGCAYDFMRDDKSDFDVVISGDSVYSIGEDAVFPTGHFRLKRQ